MQDAWESAVFGIGCLVFRLLVSARLDGFCALRAWFECRFAHRRARYFLCSAKESTQRNAAPMPLTSCAARPEPGASRRVILTLCPPAASLPLPVRAISVLRPGCSARHRGNWSRLWCGWGFSAIGGFCCFCAGGIRRTGLAIQTVFLGVAGEKSANDLKPTIACKP